MTRDCGFSMICTATRAGTTFYPARAGLLHMRRCSPSACQPFSVAAQLCICIFPCLLFGYSRQVLPWTRESDTFL